MLSQMSADLTTDRNLRRETTSNEITSIYLSLSPPAGLYFEFSSYYHPDPRNRGKQKKAIHPDSV